MTAWVQLRPVDQAGAVLFLIPQLDEDDQEGRIHFQQDGAPPHYLGEVREYLNTRFPPCIILPSTSWSPQWSLSLRFPHKNLVQMNTSTKLFLRYLDYVTLTVPRCFFPLETVIRVYAVQVWFDSLKTIPCESKQVRIYSNILKYKYLRNKYLSFFYLGSQIA
jgi:hypothetical protein